MTTTDTRMKLPSPAYKVVQVNSGNRRHYEVTRNGVIHRLPGVTGTLGIISKGDALLNWANNQGLASMCAAMVAFGLKQNFGVKAEAAWIADAIKRAKKKKDGMVAALAADISTRYPWPKRSTFKLDPLTLANIIEGATKAPKEVKEKAAAVGSTAHEFFDLYCQGKAPPLEKVEPDALPSVERFLKWIKESGLVIAAGETMVASLEFSFGGELDAVFAVDDPTRLPPEVQPLGLVEGDLVIGDYKTSNGIYDEYAYQVSAYRRAFHETYGILCPAGVVLRFGKDRPLDEKGQPLPLDFEAKWIADPDRSFRAFLAAKKLQDACRGDHFIEPPKDEKAA